MQLGGCRVQASAAKQVGSTLLDSAVLRKPFFTRPIPASRWQEFHSVVFVCEYHRFKSTPSLNYPIVPGMVVFPKCFVRHCQHPTCLYKPFQRWAFSSLLVIISNAKSPRVVTQKKNERPLVERISWGATRADCEWLLQKICRVVKPTP